MKNAKTAVWGVVLLALLSATGVGCGGADASESKSDTKTETKTQATEASTSGDAESKSKDSGGKKGKKDGEGEGEGEEEKKKEEAVPVEVATLELGAIESVLSFSANLEAERSVKVFSQARRLVTRLLVEEGDRVRKNQALLRLQDDEQRSAVAKVQSQLAKAEREYEQQKRLFAQELISEQAFNNATYELDQLKIALEDARRELSYTEVRAPIAGTVTERLVNLGDQVQIGQHLFDVVDFQSLVARVYVPEKHMETLSEGLPARLSTQSAGERVFDASVKRIAPTVDPRSGTVKVTLDVGGQKGLRPGMYVDVDLVTATRDDAVLVPKRAVVYDNDQMYVFRLGDERRVERVFIETRLADKSNIEPRQGLDAGDRVVVAGQTGLKDAALVKLPGDPEDKNSADDDSSTTAEATERASL